MKIAVNTRLLLKDKMDGIGWFAYENLKRITSQHKEHQFIFIFDRPFSDEFLFADNIIPVVVPPPARHPFLYYIWFEYSIPYILNKHKPDLFFSPDGWISLSSGIKSLAVIHDLNFEHYPEFLPYLYRKYYLHYFPKFARKASRLATVSEFSKKDIVEKYKIVSDKIDVVYNGASESYKPLNTKEQEDIRIQYTGGVPYFLFVGTIHQRKNIANLFKSYDLFRKKTSANIKLVMAGHKMWMSEEISQAYDTMQFKEDVIFLGRVSSEELKKVTASALAMTYVSYFEGFGIPILESMYCNVPVITSNITSMPEVAGDAALLVNPFSVESISDAMQKISADESLRNRLIDKGRAQRQLFTWDKTAARLWQSIEKVVENK